MRRTALPLVLAVCALLAACTNEPEPMPVEFVPLSCDQLDGVPTQKILSRETCQDAAGNTHYLAPASTLCVDGTQLYWNDFGWGYTNGTWSTHARPDGQLIPPDAETQACEGQGGQHE